VLPTSFLRETKTDLNLFTFPGIYTHFGGET
jgi:hypothetical protein